MTAKDLALLANGYHGNKEQYIKILYIYNYNIIIFSKSIPGDF